ncbi:MAG: alpha/beta hydrolase, partial [Candidatus Marinimicrobia bacterium]|nr:alpha/beta hydrolase [Candidatus Neomarinimicrobiota bacterium]
FAKMDGGIAWRGFRDFMWFPNRDKYRRFFDWMGGTYSTPKSDLWLEHLLDVIEYGSVGMFDVPQHRVYSRAELKNVSMPVLIMAGGKPIVYKDPEVFAEAAAKALPHAQIEIVPETGHSLNVEKADTVNTIIVDFLLANYPN